MYLKRKFDPRYFDSPQSVYNTSKNTEKCVFIEGGERCCQKNIPLSKYCRKRKIKCLNIIKLTELGISNNNILIIIDILRDPTQVLFSECGASTTSSSTCKTPIIASINPQCPLHLTNAIGCLNTLEVTDLYKLDPNKLSSLTHSGPPEYPPESLRAIAARLRLQANDNVAPVQPDVESELALGISNGSGLVRIKQEILDQSNLSSEDARDNESTDVLPHIQVFINLLTLYSYRFQVL